MHTASTPPPANLFAPLADTLTTATSLEGLVRPLLELLEVASGLESTYMTTIDETVGVQHVLYSRNSRSLIIPEGLTVPWGDTLCKRALEEGRSYTDDVAGCWGDSDAAQALGITTYASTPIRGADGALHGTLCAASNQRLPLRDGTERVLNLFAYLIGRQVEREQLLQSLQAANSQLQRNAMTDVVTGLPNRRALLEELDRRLRHRARDGGDVLIAFIDLDGFKHINDHFGHDAGDHFLVAIGSALASCHRSDDFCARIGGDEFVVVGSVPADSENAPQQMCERLRAATTGRFDLGGRSIEYAGPSIGVVKAATTEAEAELARADAAMYADKRLRRQTEKGDGTEPPSGTEGAKRA